MNYICKPVNAKVPTVTELQSVRHPSIRKQYDSITIPGIGTAPIMRDTGKYDNSTFSIHTKRAGYINVIASREGVKTKLRRIRPDEQAQLDALDAQIAELHEKKNELLKLAWNKAHVVTVKELEEMTIK